MWYHFVLAFCCFTVAVTASARSPAKVRIHHERSTHAELIASVEALGKTHHLKLKRTLMPSVPLHEVRQDDNGTVTIVEIIGNETRSYYEDEETGAFLFMNNENTLEGMVSDSVALHYENNEHTASEVNEETAIPFCDVSHDKIMVDLPKHIESCKLQIETKGVTFVVELVVVVDSILYNHKGSSNIVEYMRVYWTMVNRRFRTVTGSSITLKLSKMLFSSSTTCDSLLMDATEPNFANMATSRDQFAKLLSFVYINFFRFDVGHLVTKRDLFQLENGNRNTAYNGTVKIAGYPCFVDSSYAYNTGISEDDGYYHGTLTTAHEIGHNLGAPHDGEGTAAACPSNQGYLMSYVRNSKNTFCFSSCSAAAMVNVYSQTHAGCLKTIDMPDDYTFTNYIAGNYETLDKQCVSLTGVSSAVADPTVSANDQCFLLKCKYVSGVTTVRITTRFPALEGTPCSTGGFCKDGSCQASWL